MWISCFRKLDLDHRHATEEESYVINAVKTFQNLLFRGQLGVKGIKFQDI